MDTNNFDATASGVLSGGGKLTKTGAGVLTLTGTNTYSGGTAITAGTLSVGADNNLCSGKRGGYWRRYIAVECGLQFGPRHNAVGCNQHHRKCAR
ncbi:hypothetical protein HED50_12665 [Ochrobactrum oryzae]|nr:hypothetical protein [Brucella oryzae]